MSKLGRFSCYSFLFVAAFFSSKDSFAQEIKRSSINSAGNTTSNSGIYLSQSIGQSSVYQKKSNDKTELRQGFQQPIVLRGENDSKTIQLLIYPNPNNGSFHLNTDLSRNSAFSFVIYDQNGKLLTDGNGVGGVEQLVTLPNQTESGNYHLHIFTPDGLSGNTKIIVTH